MAEPRSNRRLDQPKASRSPRFVLDPDAFARLSERIARFMGTGRFLAVQTVIVIAWIGINIFAVTLRWDSYPFILLNLAFSTQAAYAAPLILLAQTRQADRDKAAVERDELRHEHQVQEAADHVAAIQAETESLRTLLQSNTDLTQQDKDLTEEVARLAREMHRLLRDQRGA